jgi:hypothetical protein
MKASSTRNIWVMIAIVAVFATLTVWLRAIPVAAATHPPHLAQATVELHLPYLTGNGSIEATPEPTASPEPTESPVPTVTVAPTPVDSVLLPYEVLTSGVMATNEEVVYRFEAEQGDTVNITLEDVNAVFAWPILTPSLKYQGSYVEGCSGWAITIPSFRQMCSIHQTGTYFIHFQNSIDVERPYNIYLQKENARPIEYDKHVVLDFTAAPHLYHYEIVAEAGDFVNVNVQHASGDQTTGFVVRNADRETICSGSGYFDIAIANCYFSQAGSYTLEVGSRFAAGTGEMALLVQKVTTPANTAPIAWDSTISDTLETRGDVDGYSFSAQEGDLVFIALNQMSGDFHRDFTLYGPDGEGICGAVPQLIPYAWAHCVIKSTGTHIIIIRDSGGTGKGSYNLRLEQIVPPPAGSELELGVTITDTIDPALNVNVYTFQGEPFEDVEVRWKRIDEPTGELSFFTPNVSIRSVRGGGEICYGWGLDASATCQIRSSSPYVILVKDDTGFNSGSYSISVRPLSD